MRCSHCDHSQQHHLSSDASEHLYYIGEKNLCLDCKICVGWLQPFYEAYAQFKELGA